QRCLYCEYDVPCMRGCPTKIDIPGFIRQIAENDPESAARTILASNVFGAVCARVCPVEKLCESLCICNTLHDKPIPIGKLQRFATDKLMASGQLPFRRGEPTGRRIAIVGAGPAGVAAAFELSRFGHDVVIFEKEREPGGLDRYGIAEYKIDANFVRREMDYLLKLGGFEIKTGRAPVDPAKLKKLLADYDAVLIAVGLGPTKGLGVPGEDLHGVVDALSFIRRIKTQSLDSVPVGRRVIVIGAGNTAIDAATQAKRLGAESVTVVYRRGREHAKCTDHEYE
ncbi:MAG: FAD-dependent oxidoreductase, partial [Deltaproteobacteria bacterium]|nr:FAD-dependent oxidoreductase [Deltaproteobacteria bacterium]